MGEIDNSMESRTYKDYSVKELQVISKFAVNEYKKTHIQEYYNIYTNCQIRLSEIFEYIEETKIIEIDKKMSLYDRVFRPFKK